MVEFPYTKSQMPPAALRLPGTFPESVDPLEGTQLDLSDPKYTVSDYLFFTSKKSTYKGVASLSGDKRSAQLSAALVPSDPNFPKASMELKGYTGAWDRPGSDPNSPGSESTLWQNLPSSRLTPEQADWRRWSIDRPPSGAPGPPGPGMLGTASAGNKLLQWEKRFEKGPNEQKGFRITDTVGTSILDPLRLYGTREQYGPDVARTLGASAQYPLGSGMLRGGVEHVSRSTPHAPDVTSYQLGYKGRVGRGDLGVQGSVEDISGMGRQSTLSGTFNWPDIFRLGGSGSVTGSYRVPPSLFKKHGAEDEYKVGLRWTKRF